VSLHPESPRCSALSAASGEPMVGSAPRTDVWVVVEHPGGWGDAALARAEHGVRVLMARGPRPAAAAAQRDGRVRVWVADVRGSQPTLRVGHVDHPDEVADWDLAGLAGPATGRRPWGEPDAGPLLLVCANGRRDRCCGHAGGRLADELWAGPRAGRVLTSTHLGGHRFAPTALLLPWGVLHGRLDLAAAGAILEAAAAGTTPTATLRGHSALPAPAQVAEAHARAVTGYEGLAALPVALHGDPDGERLSARVGLPDGSARDVALARTVEDRLASCGRARQPLQRWALVG
jgi:hypothetical protein